MSGPSLLFVNGPVQNGDFTFAERPGKAVGIRLAETLNGILGTGPAPHLWNTVTLSGDRRHREDAVQVDGGSTRRDLESRLIRKKYEHGPPSAEVLTDADPPVVRLALELVERALSAGRVRIDDRVEMCCAACGHLSVVASQPCHACGNPTHGRRSMRLLVADRTPERAALDHRRIHALRRRSPRHLRGIAENVPATLILSRTRAYGIDLEPLGLPAGLVLDPRAGVHLTALEAARQASADRAIMAITDNAAANVAGYGEPFLDHDEPELLYALHGRLPYEGIDQLDSVYRRFGLSAASRRVFERCFLPLWSWKNKSGTPATQLPSLLKHYHRSSLLVSTDRIPGALDRVRQHVRDGNPDWIGDKSLLAEALAQTCV